MAFLYDTQQWRKARAAYLRLHPLCVMCRRDGRTVLASVVDHIRPHRGDVGLFFDQRNWQPLCKTHHDSTKQRIEKGFAVAGADVNGVPTDPGHHWNK